jgi:ribosomal protein S18 acetylase RimI-like enzyme
MLAPHFALRQRMVADTAFLLQLFLACERERFGRYGIDLATAMPQELLDIQFRSRETNFIAAYPEADSYIILGAGGEPMGRFMVDLTTPDASQGVDLAILPGKRDGAPGLKALRAWVGVADAHGRPCSLSVMPDNPALHLYRRLGFLERDGTQVPVPMDRTAVRRHAISR